MLLRHPLVLSPQLMWDCLHALLPFLSLPPSHFGLTPAIPLLPSFLHHTANTKSPPVIRFASSTTFFEFFCVFLQFTFCNFGGFFFSTFFQWNHNFIFYFFKNNMFPLLSRLSYPTKLWFYCTNLQHDHIFIVHVFLPPYFTI